MISFDFRSQFRHIWIWRFQLVWGDNHLWFSLYANDRERELWSIAIR